MRRALTARRDRNLRERSAADAVDGKGRATCTPRERGSATQTPRLPWLDVQVALGCRRLKSRGVLLRRCGRRGGGRRTATSSRVCAARSSGVGSARLVRRGRGRRRRRAATDWSGVVAELIARSPTGRAPLVSAAWASWPSVRIHGRRDAVPRRRARRPDRRRQGAETRASSSKPPRAWWRCDARLPPRRRDGPSRPRRRQRVARWRARSRGGRRKSRERWRARLREYFFYSSTLAACVFRSLAAS